MGHFSSKKWVNFQSKTTIINTSTDKALNEIWQEKLRNNAFILRYLKRFIRTEERLIVNILEKKQAEYNDLGFMAYESEYKINFIDILIERIDDDFPYDNDMEEKNKNLKKVKKQKDSKKRGFDIKNIYSKKNGGLLKHYLLKYIQKSLPRYEIEYSNTLLNEYDFQKISLEIDMTIPQDAQEKVMKDAIEELYRKDIQFNYSEFIGRTMIKELENIKFDSVRKGKRGERHTSMQERVADIFCIYDAKKNGASDHYCAELLSYFYRQKEMEVCEASEKSVKLLWNIISDFMKEFEKKYKIQPVSFPREKANYKEQIRKSLESPPWTLDPKFHF